MEGVSANIGNTSVHFSKLALGASSILASLLFPAMLTGSPFKRVNLLPESFGVVEGTSIRTRGKRLNAQVNADNRPCSWLARDLLLMHTNGDVPSASLFADRGAADLDVHWEVVVFLESEQS